MPHPLLDSQSTDLAPAAYLASVGHVFHTWGWPIQDSGNVSYGVEIDGQRYFVKTAGDPADPRPYLTHPQRVALLKNAADLWRSCPHPALPRLHNVIASPHGPLLVYEWLDGELIRVPREQRDDPASSYQRFRNLPVHESLCALDLIYDLHRALADQGWIAVDFYDGCLIYDFERRSLRIMDLDMYRRGPFVNQMGRGFGSSRFMAPEEFELGARIDQRTNVYTMGRTALLLLSDGSTDPEPFRGSSAQHTVIARACRPDPADRYATMTAFCAAWDAAR